MLCPEITEGFRRMLLIAPVRILYQDAHKRRSHRVAVQEAPRAGPEGGFRIASDAGLAPIPSSLHPRDAYLSLATSLFAMCQVYPRFMPRVKKHAVRETEAFAAHHWQSGWRALKRHGTAPERIALIARLDFPSRDHSMCRNRAPHVTLMGATHPGSLRRFAARAARTARK